tara:strand:- start:3516 stop:3710 length:195 start_codon:yes stop_codon:yes gene_type:complete
MKFDPPMIRKRTGKIEATRIISFTINARSSLKILVNSFSTPFVKPAPVRAPPIDPKIAESHILP